MINWWEIVLPLKGALKIQSVNYITIITVRY